VAGVWLVRTLLERAGADGVTISHGGVRTGLAMELLFGAKSH
jgi:hypothetical protein